MRKQNQRLQSPYFWNRGRERSSPENREGKENNNSIIALNIVRNCFQHYPPPFLRHHTNVTVSSTLFQKHKRRNSTLMGLIRSTSLLGWNSKNWVHVVITHVRTLGGHVFGGDGEGKSLTSFTDHCLFMGLVDGEEGGLVIIIIVFCIHFRFSIFFCYQIDGHSAKCSSPTISTTQKITVIIVICMKLTDRNVSNSRKSHKCASNQHALRTTRELLDQLSSSCLVSVCRTVEGGPGTVRRWFVPNFDHLICIIGEGRERYR